MAKYLSTNTVLGTVLAMIIAAVGAWVFSVNAQVKVLESRQNGHENLVIHPPAQKMLTEIIAQQAAQQTELRLVNENLNRIFDKLDE